MLSVVCVVAYRVLSEFLIECSVFDRFYFIAGEKAGPSKLEKAKKFETPVISLDEFLQMIS